MFTDFTWGVGTRVRLTLYRLHFFDSCSRYGRCYGVTDLSNRDVTVIVAILDRSVTPLDRSLQPQGLKMKMLVVKQP